jgi:hypothetical protein
MRMASRPLPFAKSELILLSPDRSHFCNRSLLLHGHFGICNAVGDRHRLAKSVCLSNRVPTERGTWLRVNRRKHSDLHACGDLEWQNELDLPSPRTAVEPDRHRQHFSITVRPVNKEVAKPPLYITRSALLFCLYLSPSFLGKLVHMPCQNFQVSTVFSRWHDL